MNTRILVALSLLLFWSSIELVAQTSSDTSNFYNPDKVRTIKLTFPTNDWADKMDSLRLYSDDLLLGNAYIEGQAYSNVGVRYRGTKSFRIGGKRNALHIKLNYVSKNQNHQSYKTLKLSNALRDPSMVREVMSYEIARDYMPAPQANYVKVYINDAYYGLFVNVEAVDDVFLEKHFDSSDNTFFKCGPQKEPKYGPNCKQNIFANLEYESDASCYFQNYEIKSDNGWDDLIELTKVLNKNPEDIASVLDVDQVLWMLAYNNVLVNLNSYSGDNSENFYLYKDDKGHFNPIIWDMNLSFGSYKNIGNGSDLNMKELQRLDPLLHADNTAKPLISKLLENPLYNKMYLSHIRDIVYDHFENGNYKKRAMSLQALIKPALEMDKNKQYTMARFDRSLETTVGKRSKIPGIVELMEVRARYLKKHPKIAIIPPTVTDVNVSKREKFSTTKVNTFNIQAKVDKLPKRVKIFYRFEPGQAFSELYMADDGNHMDGTAGDKVFGVVIDPDGKYSEIEYFIVAENATAASFDPPKYMFEPYRISLDELN